MNLINTVTRTSLKLIFSLFISAFLLYILFKESNVNSVYLLVSGINLYWLLAYCLFSLFSMLLRAVRYRMIIIDAFDCEPAPTIGQMTVVTLLRNALVDLLPARLGEAGFIFLLNRLGIPIMTGLVTFGLCLFFDILVLIGLFVFLLLWHLENLVLAAFLILGFAISIFYGLRVGDYLMQLGSDRINRFLGGGAAFNLPRLANALKIIAENLAVGASELRKIKERKSEGKLLLITAGIRLFKYLALYSIFISVVSQYDIMLRGFSPLLITVAFISAEAVASLPISGFMGFGAYEGVWAAIFSLSSVKIDNVNSVILLIHVITQVFGYGLAFVALLSLCCTTRRK